MRRHLSAGAATLLLAAGLALGITGAADAHDTPLQPPTYACTSATTATMTVQGTTQDIGGDAANTTVTLTSSQGTITQTPTALHKPTPDGTKYVGTVPNLPANGSTVTFHAITRWSSTGTDDKSVTGTLPSAATCRTQYPTHITVGTTFTDNACVNGVYTAPTRTAPDVTGATKTLTGTVAPGQTAGSSYAAQQFYVIDGTKTFSHTYPATPAGQADCNPTTPPPPPPTCEETNTCPVPPPPPVCDVCHMAQHPTTAPQQVVCSGTYQGATYNDVITRRNRSCTMVNDYINGDFTSTRRSTNITQSNVSVVGADTFIGWTGTVHIGGNGSTCGIDPWVGQSVEALSGHNFELCGHMQVCKQAELSGLDGRIMVNGLETRLLTIHDTRTLVRDPGVNHGHQSIIRLRKIDVKHLHWAHNHGRVIDVRNSTIGGVFYGHVVLHGHGSL